MPKSTPVTRAIPNGRRQGPSRGNDGEIGKEPSEPAVAGQADADADQRSDQGKKGGFGQKKEQDAPARGAQGLEQADFRGPLGDRHQHDVHHQHPGHQQADGADAANGQGQGGENAVKGRQHRILGDDRDILLVFMALLDNA